MKKIVFCKYFVFLVFVLGLFFGSWIYLKKETNFFNKGREISLGGCTFRVEEAVNENDRRKGLSSRDYICKKCGMLFVFDKLDIYGFWMKDMKFDLDIIWIKDNQVIGINEFVKYDSLNTFYPKDRIDRVLEINAGEAKACGIKEGQILN